MQATLEDVSSRATDLLATIDMKKGVAYQSVSLDVLTMSNRVSGFLAQTVRIKETCEEEDLITELTLNVKVHVHVRMYIIHALQYMLYQGLIYFSMCIRIVLLYLHAS